MKTDSNNPEDLSMNMGNAGQNNRSSRQPEKAAEKGNNKRDNEDSAFKQQQKKHVAVVRFWTAFREALDGLQVWQVAAHAINHRPNNLFYSFNHPYLASGVGVVNFMAFWFSIGLPAMPDDMWARREGRMVTLSWSDNSAMGGCTPDDELVLGYFYDSNPEAPQLIRVTNARRKDKWLRVEIPVNNDPEGETLHLYPFFASKDKLRFSKNYYFKV